ncbi:hypothetical protein Krac_10020 [Ktedonobacter racemifer DSM 44963]|uniref:Uncharacterized protein n=1 Tax=Ktedonobacter racemifer DSM 44963 TaxID=485913 RepID=D6TEU6_KTERA|nr:hypothetical protein Krac_10020 [Ktedonobacter racemifer DSM 44963]
MCRRVFASYTSTIRVQFCDVMQLFSTVPANTLPFCLFTCNNAFNRVYSLNIYTHGKEARHLL